MVNNKESQLLKINNKLTEVENSMTEIDRELNKIELTIPLMFRCEMTPKIFQLKTNLKKFHENIYELKKEVGYF